MEIGAGVEDVASGTLASGFCVVDVLELSSTKNSDPDVTHLEIGGGVEDAFSVVIILVDFVGGAGVVLVVQTLEVTFDHVLIFPNCSSSIASSSLSVGLLFSVVPLVVIVVDLFATGLLVVVVVVVVFGGIRGVLLGHFRLLVTGVVARLALPVKLSAIL